jgi:hypothetical protein
MRILCQEVKHAQLARAKARYASASQRTAPASAACVICYAALMTQRLGPAEQTILMPDSRMMWRPGICVARALMSGRGAAVGDRPPRCSRARYRSRPARLVAIADQLESADTAVPISARRSRVLPRTGSPGQRCRQGRVTLTTAVSSAPAARAIFHDRHDHGNRPSEGCAMAGSSRSADHSWRQRRKRRVS